MARHHKIIAKLPDATKDEINDKNKGDFLVKAIAVSRIVRLIIQLIIRYLPNKASSQLEIITVAYSVCAFITYCMIWNQPQDATTPIYIEASKTQSIDQFKEIVKSGPIPFWTFLDFQIPSIQYNSYHFVTEKEDANLKTHKYVFLNIGIGALIFGSIYLLVWNFLFPTYIEKLLWKTSSFITALLPMTLILIFMIPNIIRKRRGRVLRDIYKP